MGVKRQQFVDKITELYTNHGVYIGTGNGELTTKLTIGSIHAMEINYGGNADINTARVLSHISSLYRAGYNMLDSRAADCSGAIVWALRELGLIPKTADYRARDFQDKLTSPVALKNLQKGDLVFDKVKSASHVGTYIGDGCVIDSRGRDKGIIKTKLSDYPWVAGGTFNWWEEEKVEYYPRYTGTSQSIVEALRTCKERDTSLEHRKRIAVANGFVKTEAEWRGTAEQNLRMLDVLKKGKLIKCL